MQLSPLTIEERKEAEKLTKEATDWDFLGFPKRSRSQYQNILGFPSRDFGKSFFAQIYSRGKRGLQISFAHETN